MNERSAVNSIRFSVAADTQRIVNEMKWMNEWMDVYTSIMSEWWNK